MTAAPQERRLQERRAQDATVTAALHRAKLAEQQRDEIREALFAYVKTIAEAGGGDKQLFMAAIREADDTARAVLAKTGGAA